jgi:hypothetical protein
MKSRCCRQTYWYFPGVLNWWMKLVFAGFVPVSADFHESRSPR